MFEQGGEREEDATVKNEYLSVEEAARVLGVGKRAVRSMAANGKLQAARQGEGAAARPVVSAASVEKLLSEGRGDAPSGEPNAPPAAARRA